MYIYCGVYDTAESVFSHFRCKYEYTKIRKFENTCDGPRWGCFAKKTEIKNLSRDTVPLTKDSI